MMRALVCPDVHWFNYICIWYHPGIFFVICWGPLRNLLRKRWTSKKRKEAPGKLALSRHDWAQAARIRRETGCRHLNDEPHTDTHFRNNTHLLWDVSQWLYHQVLVIHVISWDTESSVGEKFEHGNLHVMCFIYLRYGNQSWLNCLSAVFSQLQITNSSQTHTHKQLGEEQSHPEDNRTIKDEWDAVVCRYDREQVADETLNIPGHMLTAVTMFTNLLSVRHVHHRSCCSLTQKWRAVFWSALTKEPPTRSIGWTSTSSACSSTRSRRTGSWPGATTKRWARGRGQFRGPVVLEMNQNMLTRGCAFQQDGLVWSPVRLKAQSELRKCLRRTRMEFITQVVPGTNIQKKKKIKMLKILKWNFGHFEMQRSYFQSQLWGSDTKTGAICSMQQLPAGFWKEFKSQPTKGETREVETDFRQAEPSSGAQNSKRATMCVTD